MYSYISWAIQHGFGVVDVNVPEYITPVASSEPVPYASPDDPAARIEGEKLISYLYTNYIEPADNHSKILMGVGNAFHAIAKLLSESEDLYQNIDGVVGFISQNPVRPVGSTSFITSWYRQNSLIYVAETHMLWARKREGKVSKRYGDVREAKGHGANEIMVLNSEEAQEWILKQVQDENATEDESDAEHSKTHIKSELMASSGLASRGDALLSDAQQPVSTTVLMGTDQP
jgi:histone deacetylase 6